jgi:hypothetical protein
MLDHCFEFYELYAKDDDDDDDAQFEEDTVAFSRCDDWLRCVYPCYHKIVMKIRAMMIMCVPVPVHVHVQVESLVESLVESHAESHVESLVQSSGHVSGNNIKITEELGSMSAADDKATVVSKPSSTAIQTQHHQDIQTTMSEYLSILMKLKDKFQFNRNAQITKRFEFLYLKKQRVSKYYRAAIHAYRPWKQEIESIQMCFDYFIWKEREELMDVEMEVVEDDGQKVEVKSESESESESENDDEEETLVKLDDVIAQHMEKISSDINDGKEEKGKQSSIDGVLKTFFHLLAQFKSFELLERLSSEDTIRYLQQDCSRYKMLLDDEDESEDMVVDMNTPIKELLESHHGIQQLLQRIHNLQNEFYPWLKQGQRVLHELLHICQQQQQRQDEHQDEYIVMRELSGKLSKVKNIANNCENVLKPLLRLERCIAEDDFRCYSGRYGHTSHGGSALFSTETTKLCLKK